MSAAAIIQAVAQFFAGCAVAGLLAWAVPIVRRHWSHPCWEDRADEHAIRYFWGVGS